MYITTESEPVHGFSRPSIELQLEVIQWALLQRHEFADGGVLVVDLGHERALAEVSRHHEASLLERQHLPTFLE
jgi:hypothetical protein